MCPRTITVAYRADINGYTTVTSIETGGDGTAVGTGTGMIGIRMKEGSTKGGVVPKAAGRQVNVTGREMIGMGGKAICVSSEEIETGRKVNVINRATIDVSRKAMYVGHKVIKTSLEVNVTIRETRDVSRKVMIGSDRSYRIRNKDKIVSGKNRGNFNKINWVLGPIC